MKLNFLFITLILSCLSCRTTISGRIVSEKSHHSNDYRGKINVARIDKEGFSEILDVKSDGTFPTIQGLSPGRYLIEPLLPGFQSNSLTVDIEATRKSQLKHDLLDKIGLGRFMHRVKSRWIKVRAVLSLIHRISRIEF